MNPDALFLWVVAHMANLLWLALALGLTGLLFFMFSNVPFFPGPPDAPATWGTRFIVFGVLIAAIVAWSRVLTIQVAP